MIADRPRMKQRGGRRRARAQQRARRQKMLAYSEMFRYLGDPLTVALLKARICVDTQEYWQLPDDPYTSEAWTGAAS